jgi:polyisoprenyl-teichoic acid--peptidoglycan teichoic acid transferase
VLSGIKWWTNHWAENYAAYGKEAIKMEQEIIRKKKKRKRKKMMRVFLIIFGLIIFSLGAGATYVYSTLNKMSVNDDIPKANTENKSKEDKKTSEDKNPLSFLPSKPKIPTNILVLGADYVPGENKDFTRRRTDTMIIAHYDPERDKLIGLSIPRDTQVEVEERIWKLNAVNAIGGPQLVINTLNELLDVNIDYYVIIDYQGFNKMIDAIGGVDVTVQYRMKYDSKKQNYHIDYEKGERVHLDGKAAEMFFRWRKNNRGEEIAATLDSGGDLGRIENQRILLRAIIDKVSKPTIITKIPGLVDKVTESVVTNMTPSEMLSYGYAFTQLGNSNIDFCTAKGEAVLTDQWFYKLYERKNIDILNTFNNNAPYFDRSNLKVNLINEADVREYTNTIRQYLVESSPYSYGNIIRTREDTELEESYVEIYDIDSQYNDVIMADFKRFGINKVMNVTGKAEYDVVVHVGKDFKYDEQ